MKSEKISILKNAAREFGMAVDRMYFPPSNRGEVKHLLRKGFLVKKRLKRGKNSSLSVIYITDKGKEYLNNVD